MLTEHGPPRLVATHLAKEVGVLAQHLNAGQNPIVISKQDHGGIEAIEQLSVGVCVQAMEVVVSGARVHQRRSGDRCHTELLEDLRRLNHRLIEMALALSAVAILMFNRNSSLKHAKPERRLSCSRSASTLFSPVFRSNGTIVVGMSALIRRKWPAQLSFTMKLWC